MIEHTEKKLESNIQQLNLSYNAEQDRLLLRIGTSDDSELVVWLTYRVARQMWRLFNMEVNLPTATSINADVLPADAVTQFNKELESAEALNKMDFETRYQPRKQKLVKDTLLATEVKFIGEQQKVLEIVCVGGVSVKVNFGPNLMLALSNMLQLAAKKAAWDMGAAAVTLAPAVSLERTESKMLH